MLTYLDKRALQNYPFDQEQTLPFGRFIQYLSVGYLGISDGTTAGTDYKIFASQISVQDSTVSIQLQQSYMVGTTAGSRIIGTLLFKDKKLYGTFTPQYYEKQRCFGKLLRWPIRNGTYTGRFYLYRDCCNQIVNNDGYDHIQTPTTYNRLDGSVNLNILGIIGVAGTTLTRTIASPAQELVGFPVAYSGAGVTHINGTACDVLQFSVASNSDLTLTVHGMDGNTPMLLVNLTSFTTPLTCPDQRKQESAE